MKMGPCCHFIHLSDEQGMQDLPGILVKAALATWVRTQGAVPKESHKKPPEPTGIPPMHDTKEGRQVAGQAQILLPPANP